MGLTHKYASIINLAGWLFFVLILASFVGYSLLFSKFFEFGFKIFNSLFRLFVCLSQDAVARLCEMYAAARAAHKLDRIAIVTAINCTSNVLNDF